MRDKARKTGGMKPRAARLYREQGAVIKDWGGRLPVALIYPNSYYLGMSNLGIHAIYKLLNSYSRVVCERVFREEESKNLPPLSIESLRPLADFAVLAFSVSYELDYFNVPQILRASGLPIYAADRDERHPLVIAGGPAITANPIPLSPFFDCQCLGEAEPILPGMLPVLFDGIGGSRQELLKSLASLPGVYTPVLSGQARITRQWLKDLDDFPATSVVMTPDTELGSLYLIEVQRGCQRGCRFCLVNNTFSPMRFRSLEKLTEQARQGLQYRKRIGLVGPAVTDHPRIRELLAELSQMGAGISISSLRINSRAYEILSELAKGQAKTITIAPETGSQRLRQVVKKDIVDDDILQVVATAAELNIKQLKLYFMLGLPTETEEDIEGIIKLVLAAKDTVDRRHGNTRLTINVAPFVPKAGTPFQWLPMASLPTLNHRLSRLKRGLAPKGIKIKAESPAWSRVQGVLARGDVKIAEVLAGIEEVSLAGWRKALAKYHLDADFYINQRWDTGQKLPWSMVDSGTRIEHLKCELEKALLT